MTENEQTVLDLVEKCDAKLRYRCHASQQHSQRQAANRHYAEEPMTKPATITDADRELFIDLFTPGWKHPESSHRWEVTSGGMDDDPRMQALAAHRLQARKEAIEEAAAYLDGYAGGHYMAQSCAAAIRALTTDGEK